MRQATIALLALMLCVLGMLTPGPVLAGGGDGTGGGSGVDTTGGSASADDGN